MGKILILLIFFVLMPLRLWAGVEFWKIFPNTVDDASMEYIEFRNTSCEEVDISGYILSDASEKEYILPPASKVPAHNNFLLPRTTSKIILNNENEVLSLKNPAGEIIDEFSYSSSTKGEIIVDLSVVDETCQTEPPTESGATNTGATQTGSTEPPPVQTGSTQTGSTGTGSPEPPSASGVVIPQPPSNTGGTVSGEVPPSEGSGITITGILIPSPGTGGTLPVDQVLFPEITPTIQSPSNATLSGSSFLCIPNSPCRVNVSFEEIFTGSFLMRDYTCEIITGSGTLTTCNPNTLYFSENTSFGFRLTSKKDMSKMKSQYWDIIFTTASSPIQTGATNTGEVAFPEIVPTFQNYSNTTQSGEYIICTTTPCRINFTLEPIFTGAFLMRDYACIIEYGTGVVENCNPPQMYPTGTGQLKVSLLHKTSGQSREKIWYFLQNPTSEPIVPGEKPEIIPDKNPPVIVLKFDGKLKGYHEIVSDEEINCYAFTCAINLTAEDSYDREGSDISFLWYYGLHDIKTSKDPGERKYGLGDYEVWLRVIDALGNMAQVRYKIHVLGPREKEEDMIVEKKAKTKAKKETKSESKKKKTSKKKKLKMTFFTPPTLILQSKKVLSRNQETYTCTTSTKNCSLNLTLSGAQKGMMYIWNYPDGTEIISRNPKSQSFPIGKHDIKISVAYSGSTDILWQKVFSFSVIKEPKTKKPKKPKKPKKSKTPEEVPLQSVHDEKLPPENPILPVVFSSTLLGVLFIRRIPFLYKSREQ